MQDRVSFDYVAMAAQITGLDTATLMRPRQQVGGRGASGVASEDRAEAELSGRLLAGFRQAHGRHARLTGDFEGERACGLLTRPAGCRHARGAVSYAPDRGGDQCQCGGQEDARLECLQRPVAAWWLVGDEQLQVTRERVQAGQEVPARQAPRLGLGGARARVRRQACRDRRADAHEQIVQLRSL